MTIPFRGNRRGGALPAPAPVPSLSLSILLLLSLSLPAGASPPPLPAGHPPLPAPSSPEVPAGAPPAPPSAGASPATLTVDGAVAAALANHPDLALFPHALDGARARVDRSSVLPNPELSVEVENLEGGFPFTERASPSVRISQEIGPWRRSPRVRAAEAELPVLALDREAARREVALSARRAFLSAVAANRRTALAEESYRLAAALASTAAERVSAGAVSPIEATRAEAALAAAEADRERAARERSDAVRELALSLGAEIPPGTRIEGTLDESLSPPPPDPGAAAGAPPEVSRWEAERKRREAEAEAERAAATPAVTVSAGVTKDREEGTSSLLLGVSLPLPLFDRNRGAVAEARAGARLAAAERRRAEILRADRTARARTAMAAASREGLLVRDRMLAKAQEAFSAVEEGYRLGKFRYTDVIEASGSLVEARKRHLEAVTAHNLARVDLEALLEPAPPTAGTESVPGNQEVVR